MWPPPAGRATRLLVAPWEWIQSHLAAGVATRLRRIAGLKQLATVAAARQPEAERDCPGSQRPAFAKPAAGPREAESSMVPDSIRGPAQARTAAWTHLTASVVEQRKTAAGSAAENLQVLSGHKFSSPPRTQRGCPGQAPLERAEPATDAGG